MIKTKACLWLSPADRSALEEWVSGRNTPQKVVWRARIILLSADRTGVMAIARAVGMSKVTVARWQERYLAKGIAAGAAHRRGRAGVDADGRRLRVLDLSPQRHHYVLGLFAAYAVLQRNTADGPIGRELFDLRNVFIETICLLLSSYTCGLGALSAERQQQGRYLVFAALTFVLGAAFLFVEISEFAGMVAKGAGPWRSAFLSGFFTLVGMHGAHVTSGLLWLLYMVAQVIVKGLRPRVLRRLLCFSLFWHALDIIWVGVFTMVYLMATV